MKKVISLILVCCFFWGKSQQIDECLFLSEAFSNGTLNNSFQSSQKITLQPGFSSGSNNYINLSIISDNNARLVTSLKSRRYYLNIYPTKFDNSLFIHGKISAGEEHSIESFNKSFHVTIKNIFGITVSDHEFMMDETGIKELGSNLLPGLYIISINIREDNLTKSFKVIKL